MVGGAEPEGIKPLGSIVVLWNILVTHGSDASDLHAVKAFSRLKGWNRRAASL